MITVVTKRKLEVLIYTFDDVPMESDFNETYPQQAASTIAMQNASVNDVFMNISPCTNT